MTRPTARSRPAYVVSWRSNARHAAPTDLAAQSETRAGSARITPIGACPLGPGFVRSCPSVALVEVAASQQLREPVILLDPEVELQVVLHDLGGHVADRARVIGEGKDDQRRVGGVERPMAGVVRDEAHEPRAERQP